MSNKILFIGFDDFSYINKPVIEQLSRHFTNYEIRTVWLKPLLKRKKITLALGVIFLFAELGRDFLTGDKKWRNWRNHFYSTGFMIRTLSSLATKEAQKDVYAFIFQTQSLFKCPPGLYGNFIYTDHTNLNNLNYTQTGRREYLASRWFRQTELKIYREATAIFVMSGNIRKSLLRQYNIPDDKVFLVYAGADGKYSINRDSKKFRNKNIVFVGKDWKRKGGPLLIEAFGKVLKKIPDATLTIIGCNPEVKINNCTISGVLPQQQIIKAYESATVFCLPTRREPFGMVFIEAMYNRLPVICPAVGATTDLIENGRNGYLVPYSAEALAEKLILVLRNPGLAESLGNQAFKSVSETYTWKNTGNLMARVIRQKMGEQITTIQEQVPDLNPANA
jgi:glycosyltransferase involved in cell wall biosynthesis